MQSHPNDVDFLFNYSGALWKSGELSSAIEVSFISNPLEELRLNTADYRQRLSDAVVNAVRAYRDGL